MCKIPNCTTITATCPTILNVSNQPSQTGNTRGMCILAWAPSRLSSSGLRRGWALSRLKRGMTPEHVASYEILLQHRL